MAEAARLAKLDPAKARPVFIEEKPDYFSSLLEQYFTGDEDDRSASMPPDWLSKQACMRRHVALQAVGDVRTMLPCSAISADCLAWRGASTRAADRTQSRRLITTPLARRI